MRRPVLFLAALMVAASGGWNLPASAAASAEPTGVVRFAGADVYETAAQLALDRYDSASDPVLANGGDPADALAGSYLAGIHASPVLLTASDALPQATAEALAALDARTVHVMGGTATISPAVADELVRLGYRVERVAGRDRYGTAAAAARDEGPAIIGAWPGKGRTVLLANGLAPWDALAAGTVADGQLLPLLLTATNALPAATSAVLADYDIEHVIVLGGTAAVSDGVVDTLERSGLSVRRVAGLDRTATAVAIAGLLEELGHPTSTVHLASATSAAPIAAAATHATPSSPILLCSTASSCGEATLGWARAHQVDAVVVAGGADQVSDDAARAVLDAG